MDIRPRYEDGVEQLKARMEKLRRQKLFDSEEEMEMKKSNLPETVRPSLIQV